MSSRPELSDPRPGVRAWSRYKGLARRYGTALTFLTTLMVTVALLLARRPRTAPPAAGLDTSIETFYAWWQAHHGLEVRGNFSWTSRSFHPGPVYNWVMVAGGRTAEELWGAPWFAWGAWAAQVLVIVGAFTASWWYLRRALGPKVATTSAAALLGWYSAFGPGEWWPHVTLAQPSWVGAMLPALLAATLASALATVTTRWVGGVAHTVFWAGLATQNHISATPLAVASVAAAFLATRGEGSTGGVRVRRTMAVLVGWWWLPVRIVSDGAGFFLPGPGGSQIQPGPLPEPSYIAWRWAEHAMAMHTGLPWWLAIVAAGTLLALAYRQLDTVAFGFVGFVAVWAVLASMALFPQLYSAWQSSWVEPVWLTALVTAAGHVIHRYKEKRGLGLASQEQRGTSALAVAVFLVAAITAVTRPDAFDGAKALNDPPEQFPQALYDTTIREASSRTLPVVLALGENPERHATALLWLEGHGVQACTLDVEPADGKNPIVRDHCNEVDTTRAIWLVNDATKEAVPVEGYVEKARADRYQTANEWRLLVPGVVGEG